MPFFPMLTGLPEGKVNYAASDNSSASDRLRPPASVQAKNRRKRYLDQHPEYFSADLEMAGVCPIDFFLYSLLLFVTAELASSCVHIRNCRGRYLLIFCDGKDPLLYDRLIRRFQTPNEREAEGRAKGFSGILQADLLRSEAKMDALAHPDPNAMLSYKRGPDGEIIAEDEDDIPATREEGQERWRWEMEMRFLKGADYEFDYAAVDDNDDYDDWNEAQEQYFDEEEPEWIFDNGQEENRQKQLTGETGIQDY